MATLLGATLVTAAPLATDKTVEHIIHLNLSTIFPGHDGLAPLNMAEIKDPIDKFMNCEVSSCLDTNCTSGIVWARDPSCPYGNLIDPVIENVIMPAAELNTTSISWDFGLELLGKRQDESAPAALERREASECPAKCAPFAALPPFSLWFGMCMADCGVRCARGLSCP
ncbi:hypothetical protein DHEL01_v209412 [Diaporthe helianthi]|uniref:Uncharacterized protein n=1 Tax=Diaporthe helianthi TaxID=158607 RepID=A0A2P5HPN0_DIAHE|nr:hypothetical protein DHEL01_v209412 [Diaporthe helianthi]